MKKLNQLHFIYGFWIALAAVCLLLTGCPNSAPHVANSEGGAYTTYADGTSELRQGANAKSLTRLDIKREDGTRTRVELGTSRDPVVTVPAAPDYTKYFVVVAGLICLIGGGVLAYKGWPKLGTRASIIGVGLIVVGLTVGEYAWAYALCLIVGGGYLLWEMYSAYRKGEREIETETVK